MCHSVAMGGELFKTVDLQKAPKYSPVLLEPENGLPRWLATIRRRVPASISNYISKVNKDV